ncbi:MAG: hypothetical protein GY895_06125 [Phycisphaera sp.]|nr:hypothetical protein [Phycisphaera sp.]
MPETTTTTTSELLLAIRDCLSDQDREAACFLREGVHEAISMGEAWLTSEEERYLASF